MANRPSVCVRVSQSCRLVNVLKNRSTSSITKASCPTIMQVAFSSVNLGSNVNPSLVKKSTERFRSRTGRFRNILRDVGTDTGYLLRVLPYRRSPPPDFIGRPRSETRSSAYAEPSLPLKDRRAALEERADPFRRVRAAEDHPTLQQHRPGGVAGIALGSTRGRQGSLNAE